jgi:hypothetical protein
MNLLSHATRIRSRASWRSQLMHSMVALLLCSASVNAQHRNTPPERIRFKIGAISAQVPGQFNPAQPRPRYVLKANAGDHMIVNVIPVTRGLTMSGTVEGPSGQGDGQPGGIVFNADLTESGDYIIEVSQHTMGSNYKSGSFIVEVVIAPAWLKN